VIDYKKLNNKTWSPVGQCITVNWYAKHKYVPASQQPDIAAKQEYFRNLSVHLGESK
jgi:hypothetical protein